MESSVQREASHLYNQLLESKVLFHQLGKLEFVTQPREIVYRENKLILYHFRPQVKKIAATPLLLVFALINRPDILDFSPDASLIKSLLQEGRDVYLLDWGYPSLEDRELSLSTYINGYLRNCIAQIKNASGQAAVDLLGICQGGVLCLCYASLFPQDLRRLALVSTPIDFQTKTDAFSRLARSAPIADWVARMGNIPGGWLAQLFLGLQPFKLLGKKYLAVLDQLSRPRPNRAWFKHFLLVEKWLQDTPDLAGKAFAQFVQIFYQQNSFLHGKFALDDECIDLRSVALPVLNLIARDDSIVPPRASRILRKYLPSAAYQQNVLPGGHVGIYLSEKSSQQLAKLIAVWLRKKDVRKSGRNDGRRAKGTDQGRRRCVGE